jgi:predicted nucleotide-binding protein (sugar kinase/HSP70/actin superfamily)
MGFPRSQADRASGAAVAAQKAFTAEGEAAGERLLAELRADPERIGVVIFGRPYNAYVPEANKSIPRKFASRGHLVIPYDILPYRDEPLDSDYASYMHWEAGQRILRVARIVARDPQLFGVYITNFLCAPDSFIVPFFRRVMGTKPSLTLELDAHTADAGINTRIDAYLDIVGNHRHAAGAGAGPRRESTGQSVHNVQVTMPSVQRGATDAFLPGRVVYEHGGARYLDSAGRKYLLTDPAVKLVIPPMGDMGSSALAAACRRVGIRAEALPRGDADVLRMGRGATSCKECLPMTICLGALLRYLERRPVAEAGEKLMILIPKAAGYCRLGQYHVTTSQHIRDHRVPDVAILDLGMEEQFAGLGARFTFHAWKAIVTTDALDDIGCALRALAVDPEGALRVFDAECAALIDAMERASNRGYWRRLAQTAKTLRAIPLLQPLEATAAVGVTGEFFVRKDPFSNLGIAFRLASRGFVVKTAAMAEWMYYVNFLIKEKRIEPHHTLSSKLEFAISDATQRVLERRIKRILSASGLYRFEMIDIREELRHALPVLPLEFHGEPALIAGFTMREGIDHLAGVVNVGPFGCMQTRFGDAVTIPATDVRGKRAAMARAGRTSNASLDGFSDEERIPFLSIESDGNPYPQLLEARFESFCLQAERIAKRTGKRVATRG